jgi:L-rhamnose isomerase
MAKEDTIPDTVYISQLGMHYHKSLECPAIKNYRNPQEYKPVSKDRLTKQKRRLSSEPYIECPLCFGERRK